MWILTFQFSAIYQASRVVCTTIKDSADEIATAMKKSLSLLSNEINEHFNALNSGLDKLGEGITSQNRQMLTALNNQAESSKQLITAVELNNSLQEKANTTSDELLNDLRYNQHYWVK